MKFISTRDKNISVSPSEAVIQGLTPDGGLFVPETIPDVTDQLNEWSKQTYPQLAANVLSLFFTDFDFEEISSITQKAYGACFPKHVAQVSRLGEKKYMLELWHGPTLAFKDMALQVLPYLLCGAMKKTGEDRTMMILVATSGDTGKAALEGFAGVDRTAITVFYPDDGVSKIQQLQMTTQIGNNVYVCAVKGNFDDAQTGVKSIFSDAGFAREAGQKGYRLSSANSINIGRLIPQIAYYFWGYFKMVQDGAITLGQPMNITVPTGNFGNILAAYYAKRMGLPVKKLICASNANNVLTDFINSGVYDKNREFYRTMSPSMDILVSSNLERLLFELSGRNAGFVKQWMEELKVKGYYSADSIRAQLQQDFYGAYCPEEETAKEIKSVFEQYGYLMDTHTAVAHYVYEKYKRETKDETPCLIASTASPYKFSADVLKAVAGKADPDEFACARMLYEASGLEVPRQIAGLPSEKVVFYDVCNKDEMAQKVMLWMSAHSL
ncbi:MAG: threonine synthase [Christensenellales bacterium]